MEQGAAAAKKLEEERLANEKLAAEAEKAKLEAKAIEEAAENAEVEPEQDEESVEETLSEPEGESIEDESSEEVNIEVTNNEETVPITLSAVEEPVKVEESVKLEGAEPVKIEEAPSKPRRRSGLNNALRGHAHSHGGELSCFERVTVERYFGVFVAAGCRIC